MAQQRHNTYTSLQAWEGPAPSLSNDSVDLGQRHPTRFGYEHVRPFSDQLEVAHAGLLTGRDFRPDTIKPSVAFQVAPLGLTRPSPVWHIPNSYLLHLITLP
jgi:hypothetical protein